jgi:hypothetical protein
VVLQLATTLNIYTCLLFICLLLKKLFICNIWSCFSCFSTVTYKPVLSSWSKTNYNYKNAECNLIDLFSNLNGNNNLLLAAWIFDLFSLENKMKTVRYTTHFILLPQQTVNMLPIAKPQQLYHGELNMRWLHRNY